MQYKTEPYLQELAYFYNINGKRRRAPRAKSKTGRKEEKIKVKEQVVLKSEC